MRAILVVVIRLCFGSCGFFVLCCCFFSCDPLFPFLFDLPIASLISGADPEIGTGGPDPCWKTKSG